MANAIHLTKIIVAWSFAVAAIVLVLLGHQAYAQPGVCALISLAVSHLPE